MKKIKVRKAVRKAGGKAAPATATRAAREPRAAALETRETRGGARPGSGRKAGSKEVDLEAASPPQETPLDYLQRIMRDQNVDPKRRDWAAKAALRFTAGLTPGVNSKLGKKAQAEQDADTAGQGTVWGDDLDFERPN